MKYNWIKTIKNERCVTIAIVQIIEKRALILSVKIQVDKKKQILDNKTNKRKIYSKSLNNNKNTVNLLGKLQFFFVPIMGQHIDIERLH